MGSLPRPSRSPFSSSLDSHVVVFGWSCHVVVVGCGHVVVVGVVHVVVVVGGGVVVHVVVVVGRGVVFFHFELTVNKTCVDFSGQVVVVGCSGQVVVLGGQFLFILFNFLL